MNIDSLGSRICIMGPSNSGKSTLANAIGAARDLRPIHLDQFYHLPNTDWKPRSSDAFIALHDEAIWGENWVMDGNYTRCLPQRLARATGFILLDTTTAISLVRYCRRSWFERNRVGALEGNKDSVKWGMLRYITITTPKNRRQYKEMFKAITLPKIMLSSRHEIAQFYQSEGISRQ